MKLPVWYKDRDGKWELFPPEIHQYLITFADGRLGIFGDIGFYPSPPWQVGGVCELYHQGVCELYHQIGSQKFWRFFDFDSRHKRYVLLNQWELDR